MLARYQIVRGQALASLPPALRTGRRVDTRMHTRHFLRPERTAVERLFAALDAGRSNPWPEFARAYRALLAERYAADRAPFDALAVEAQDRDVFLGCNCPTTRVTDVRRCHTSLALAFMRERYPGLDVRMPKARSPG